MGNSESAYQNRLAKYAYAQSRNQKVLPSVEAETIYGKLLIIAACTDGTVAAKERKWIIESRLALGVPKKVISMLEKFNPIQQEIEDFLLKEKDFIKLLNRSLVYDCCEMAACDGNFTKREREIVDIFAKRIGLDQELSHEIQNLFDEEKQARKKRTITLFPNGVDTAIQTASDEKAKRIGRA